jgi:predicted Zn finger-like uncharacterized protein
MLIVCPNCATSYALGANALGTTGRKVRCARCQTQWFATPTRDETPTAIVDELIAEAASRTQGMASPIPAPPPMAARAVAQPAAPRPQQDSPPPSLNVVPPPAVPEPPFTAPPAYEPPATALPDDNQIANALESVSSVQPMSADDIAIQRTPLIDAGDAPPLVPPDATDSAVADEESAVTAAQDFAARRAARIAAEKRRKRAVQVPAVAILLAITAGALMVWRHDLVRHVPQTASLFAAIGMPVNLRNLTFDGVTVAKEAHDGIAVLVIEGNIVSVTNRPTEVPRLRFAVRNSSGNEIYTWTAPPPKPSVAPGESISFRSRLASPPADAQDILVRFFSVRDLPAGGK